VAVARRDEVVLLVVLASVALLGCAEDPPAGQPDVPGKEGVAEPVEEAMADGVADFAEYDAAVVRFVDCLGRAGFEVGGLRLMEDSQLYDYRIPVAAVDAGADAGCYAQELHAIDLSWQESPARPRGANELRGMAPLLARCMALNGIEYDLAVTEWSDPGPLEEVLAAHGITLDECASQVAESLGP
jgi:hypothetical protein